MINKRTIKIVCVWSYIVIILHCSSVKINSHRLVYAFCAYNILLLYHICNNDSDNEACCDEKKKQKQYNKYKNAL